jgi:hypothetical protein
MESKGSFLFIEVLFESGKNFPLHAATPVGFQSVLNKKVGL